ncbi:type II toxin-antitoxin system VapC family toxin [Rhizobium cauense]|uniref:type II toxin-antitoxin system VapC family toxin n=1 Tax=Rhizobium cauense TaxID=1166683 RepID=UPI003B83156D
MVIDTSVLAAIAFNEPEGKTFHEHIADDPSAWRSKADVEIVPITAEHSYNARRAWHRFGNGRHPASLNYGDCFSQKGRPVTLAHGRPHERSVDDKSRSTTSRGSRLSQRDQSVVERVPDVERGLAPLSRCCSPTS